jgi:hypothetical protein
MDAFLEQYDRQRALAESDDSVLQARHPDLDVDQTFDLSQASTQPLMPSEANHALLNEVLTAWMPLAMNQDYGPGREGSWEFHADKEHLPAGLAEQMDLLREKIDDLFAWSGKRLSQEWRQKRGAAQARETERVFNLFSPLSARLFPSMPCAGNIAASRSSS